MGQPEPQDYIAELEAQRNAALNELVNVKAKLSALLRLMKEKQPVEEGGE